MSSSRVHGTPFERYIQSYNDIELGSILRLPGYDICQSRAPYRPRLGTGPGPYGHPAVVVGILGAERPSPDNDIRVQFCSITHKVTELMDDGDIIKTRLICPYVDDSEGNRPDSQNSLDLTLSCEISDCPFFHTTSSMDNSGNLPDHLNYAPIQVTYHYDRDRQRQMNNLRQNPTWAHLRRQLAIWEYEQGRISENQRDDPDYIPKGLLDAQGPSYVVIRAYELPWNAFRRYFNIDPKTLKFTERSLNVLLAALRHHPQQIYAQGRMHNRFGFEDDWVALSINASRPSPVAPPPVIPSPATRPPALSIVVGTIMRLMNALRIRRNKLKAPSNNSLDPTAPAFIPRSSQSSAPLLSLTVPPAMSFSSPGTSNQSALASLASSSFIARSPATSVSSLELPSPVSPPKSP